MATLPPIAAYQTGNDAPWTRADPVTTHDSNDLPYHSRGLFVGTGGDVVVTMSGEADNTVTGCRTYKNVPDGVLLPIMVRRVWTTSTATDMMSGT